jgi:hypothetical protein
MRRPLTAIALMAAILLGGGSTSALAQVPTRCNEIFPEASWTGVDGMTIDLGVSDVPDGQVRRFADEIEASAARIEADIGGLSEAAICVVGPNVVLDTTAYLDRSRRFHAILDGPNDFVALSAENVGSVKPAAAFGLAQLALWNHSDGAGWPEPLASAIAHWYRGLSLDRMDIYHKQAQGADFRVNALTGESSFGLDFSTDARIDWFASRQPPTRAWDPATNEVPIGDFIDFTVAGEGSGALLDTDTQAWAAREAAWRTQLVSDLTGRTTPTTAWKVGVGLIVVLLVVAGIIATAGWLAKRRRTHYETPPPVPGFFSSASKD